MQEYKHPLAPQISKTVRNVHGCHGFGPLEPEVYSLSANLNVLCSSNAAMPLLWQHPFHGSSKSSHFFPSSAARAVHALRSQPFFLVLWLHLVCSQPQRFIIKNDPFCRNHKVLCLPLNYCFILISNYVLKAPQCSRRYHLSPAE